MSTDLEPHGGSGGEVFHVKIHLHLALLERVGHFQTELPREVFEVFGQVFDSQCHAVGTLLHDVPLAFAHKAVFGEFIFFAFVAERAIPCTSHEGEEDGRVSIPEGFIAMPNDFFPALDESERVHLST